MKHFTQQWKKPLAAWVWAFACAAGVVSVCSRSSFFYPLNNWGDAQCFFTVGKSMVRGQVLYRDIYEQKGPLVLFLHGLASFVQRNGFLGVFLLEVLAAGVFLWFCQKIMALYGAGSLRFAALPLVLAVQLFLPQLPDGRQHGRAVPAAVCGGAVSGPAGAAGKPAAGLGRRTGAGRTVRRGVLDQIYPVRHLRRAGAGAVRSRDLPGRAEGRGAAYSGLFRRLYARPACPGCSILV